MTSPQAKQNMGCPPLVGNDFLFPTPCPPTAPHPARPKTKPHPNFFHTIQQTLDLPAHAILLVGDDVRNDFLGAAEAGWQSVLLDRTGTSELPAIRSLRQLCKLLA